MKKAIFISTIFLIVMAESRGQKMGNDNFFTVDVRKKYSPKKELFLQDFMNVEYIPLETNDDFLCQGRVLAIGKDIMLIKNRVNDGDIFVYDRNGKALKKINRKGQSGEEYTCILGIVLDEDNEEMFVNDNYTRRILVYDLDGNFKRNLRHKEGTMYNKIYNFDRETLICNDDNLNDDGIANMQSLMIISKQDGSIAKEIPIPFKKKKTTRLILKDEVNGRFYASGPSSCYPIIPYLDNWILVEPSSDTVYQYSSDHHTMTPFIARTPSIQSMNPEVFLFLSILTDRYYFMESVKKIYDFETRQGFPSTDLIYDKQEKAIFEYTVYNDDYSNKKQVYMNSRPVNDEIATWQSLEADQLVEAYGKGELKGKLKEIAAELDEDSNPVIMLIKHKK
jgi:hypothetical protein